MDSKTYRKYINSFEFDGKYLPQYGRFAVTVENLKHEIHWNSKSITKLCRRLPRSLSTKIEVITYGTNFVSFLFSKVPSIKLTRDLVSTVACTFAASTTMTPDQFAKTKITPYHLPNDECTSDFLSFVHQTILSKEIYRNYWGNTKSKETPKMTTLISMINQASKMREVLFAPVTHRIITKPGDPDYFKQFTLGMGEGRNIRATIYPGSDKINWGAQVDDLPDAIKLHITSRKPGASGPFKAVITPNVEVAPSQAFTRTTKGLVTSEGGTCEEIGAFPSGKLLERDEDMALHEAKEMAASMKKGKWKANGPKKRTNPKKDKLKQAVDTLVTSLQHLI